MESRTVNVYVLAIFLLLFNGSPAQQSDSVQLNEVIITSFFSGQPLVLSPVSVAVIDSTQLSTHHGQSLVPAMNTVPGVRMEERSPGSYRLSIRGSLLRSPFGVRNVKVYIDEFPLTDGGGNTYLNLIDPGAVQRMEISKGPDGSLYGANSGGVVRMQLTGEEMRGTYGTFSAGSFGMLRGNIGSHLRIKRHHLQVHDGWIQSNGYREQSRMRRQYFHIADRWNYTEGFELQLLFFTSDLRYETPGGLTLEQFNTEPRAARPATAVLPGAVEQRTAVFNRTYYGGILHRARLTPWLDHAFAMFASGTNFQNPFITNYEFRRERGGGIRTWLHGNFAVREKTVLNAWLGFEGQQAFAEIDNYTNASGTPGALLVAHDLQSTNYFFFSRVVADFSNRFMVEAALSLNFSAYEFQPVYPQPASAARRSFTPQWMPKLGASWAFAESAAWRACVSRGFSAPTIAEIRSSDNTINTALQPEAGWNVETGIRLHDGRGIAWWDWSMFFYRLDNAIVRRLNEAGQEYFVNSGGTIQPGFESLVELHVLRNRSKGFFREGVIRASYTYNAFRFRGYTIDTLDFSGNDVTGIPEHVLVVSFALELPAGFSFFVQHSYVSALPLNDENTAYAAEYHLLQSKITWQRDFRKYRITIFAGADNLLDERYSLGNDLNAAGGRYYNAAPGRNYFAGLAINIINQNSRIWKTGS